MTFACVCFDLFECQRLGLLLAGTRLPHTDGGAGASSNDQFGVGTDGTEDLTPLGQTLVHHQRLESAQQMIGGAQSRTAHIWTAAALPVKNQQGETVPLLNVATAKSRVV